MSPALRLTLTRVVPVAVLVVVAIGAQRWFGMDRVWAAGTGLVVAIFLRLALARLFPIN